ncbi:MAG: type III pantothenate kinase [Clostridia bacterium]|nr:type III pantothenate kinase [Clostridia bacterium]
MIFCIDIGNTNIKYAVFDGDNLKATFRVSSQKYITSDEYGVIVRDLLKTANISKSEIKGAIMSSVIPSLNYTMEHMCRDYLSLTPLIVGPGIKTGLNIKVDNSKEVGSDIIVDSVSAIKRYGGRGKPIICIDFGTATTFDIISEKNELIGVVIAPGIKGSLDSLVNGTANLPSIELDTPSSIIAKNTVSSMKAGVTYGFAGLVDNIVAKIKAELKREDALVVVTGGMSGIIEKQSSCIDIIDRSLTINGLKILYELNEEVK